MQRISTLASQSLHWCQVHSLQRFIFVYADAPSHSTRVTANKLCEFNSRCKWGSEYRIFFSVTPEPSGGTRIKRKKRGKREGVRFRKQHLNKIPLPSVIMGNVQSPRNKLDRLQGNIRFQKDYRDCCVMAFRHCSLNATRKPNSPFMALELPFDWADTIVLWQRPHLHTWCRAFICISAPLLLALRVPTSFYK